MKLQIMAARWQGEIAVPSSKSMGHRHLIAAALSRDTSYIKGITPSDDIEATIEVLRSLGVEIQRQAEVRPHRYTYLVQGGMQSYSHPIVCDARESASTLRLLLPLAIYSDNKVLFTGRGRLTQRSLAPYQALCMQQGIYWQQSEHTFPLTVQGHWTAGTMALRGDISSQFFSGLLFVLPLLKESSTVISTTPLESADYVNLTCACLREHGVAIQAKENAVYFIRGGQTYRAGTYHVEGDYSQAAFWLAAGVLRGTLTCSGLNRNSLQGDRQILALLQQMGGHVGWEGDKLTARQSNLQGIDIDVSGCPDLFPVLAAVGTQATGVTRLYHAARLRYKESDRLHAMATALQTLGATVTERADQLCIVGPTPLRGGTVSGSRDHRIVMALAILAPFCQHALQIEDAQAVVKSYPCFWQDIQKVGGILTQEETI